MQSKTLTNKQLEEMYREESEKVFIDFNRPIEDFEALPEVDPATTPLAKYRALRGPARYILSGEIMKPLSPEERAKRLAQKKPPLALK